MTTTSTSCDVILRGPVLRHSLLDAIGHTPIACISGVFCKLEHLNPGGSIKDRVALEMITDAEQSGELRPGGAIIEASSGNTGISLAMVGAARGYQVIIVMPENMSKERRLIMEALGAKVMLTSSNGSLYEAIQAADDTASRYGYFSPRQFSNPANVRAQEKTGQEILAEIGPVDAVVAGVGTGGTLMGIASVMKAANPDVQIIAVEPEEAAVMFGGSSVAIREHSIQGIGDGFIPKIVNMECIDRVITVSSQTAITMTRELFRTYGLLAGISAGANMHAALVAAQTAKKVVTVIPDRAERYLSMSLF